MDAQEALHKNNLPEQPASVPPGDTPASHPGSQAAPERPASAGTPYEHEIEKAAYSLQAVKADSKQFLSEVEASETTKEKAAHSLQVIETDAKLLLNEVETNETAREVVEDVKTFGEFWLKFLNDWVLNFASGLAYSLLMAMVPIVVALAAIIGFLQGELNHSGQQALITYLGSIFPAVLGPDILKPALTLLNRDAGFLGIIAIVLAFYNGSRLFATMENYFAIIYHTPLRSFWRQNLMALIMLLIFMALIPIMLLASSVGLRGFVGGIIASWILFQAIYMIVPNQKISWRKSWRGTLVAVVALQIYAALFPLYIQHFMGSYTGNTGFAIILLLFFYYSAIILLIGAEINAFYAEGVRAKPRDIAEMVHLATLVSDRQEIMKLAREKIERDAMKR